jgi:hypothetical protein
VFRKRHGLLDKENPDVLLVVVGWSACFALLGYKESMSRLRLFLPAPQSAADVAKFDEDRALARTSAWLNGLGVFGLLAGGLWVVVDTEGAKPRRQFLDVMKRTFAQLDNVAQPVLLYQHTPEGPKVILTNKLARKFYNYDGDDILGLKPSDIYGQMGETMDNQNKVQKELQDRSTSARRGKFDASTTQTPQILNDKHKHFHGRFYCSTLPIKVARETYYLTLLRAEHFTPPPEKPTESSSHAEVAPA